MHVYDLSQLNRQRCDRWHAGVLWTGADWSNSMCGEAGEAANVVKKLRRHETLDATQSYNTPPVKDLMGMLCGEVADVVLYCDLLAHHYGIDLETAIISKFNKVSQATGAPERMS